MVRLAKGANKQATQKANPPAEELDDENNEGEVNEDAAEEVPDETDGAAVEDTFPQDDDEEDEEEEEEEEAVEAEEDNNHSEKRKADSEEDSPDAKKAKPEEPEFCLIVGNLNTSKEDDELKESLKGFFAENSLEVVEVRIREKEKGQKYGYVDFASEEDLDKALELNGQTLLDQELKLEKAPSQDSKFEERKEKNARTLFAKNLPFSATPEELKKAFKEAIDLRIPTGDKNKGIAYIVFESEAVAEKVMEEINGTEILGRTVRLDFVGEKSKNKRGGQFKTLFVRGLSEDTTDETLKEAFKGSVSARIVSDRETGVSKGYGFVEFETEKDCTAAKESMEGAEIDGNTVALDFAKPKFNKPRGGPGGGRGGYGGFGGGRGGGGGWGRGGFGGGYGGGYGGGGWGGGGRGGRGGWGGRGGGPGGRGGWRGRGGFGGGRGGGFYY
ncbi:unnamed protein product [Knipowitschia caucasica]